MLSLSVTRGKRLLRARSAQSSSFRERTNLNSEATGVSARCEFEAERGAWGEAYAATEKLKMYWSTVPFGKYAGNTLPEIIIRDPDWFFWAVPKLYGRIGEEAKDLAREARGIKIPKPRPGKWMVEYRRDCDQRFAGLDSSKPIVPKSRWTTRLWHLDLALPLRRKTYDKRAGRITIAEFRRLYFGERKRITKQRCEEFFSHDANFVTI
jgi:hypothetical protein